MFCLTPKFDEEPYFSEADARDGLRLQYGFILDTVDIGDQIPQENKFHLFPNPVYDKFEEKIKKYKSDYLTINVSSPCVLPKQLGCFKLLPAFWNRIFLFHSNGSILSS